MIRAFLTLFIVLLVFQPMFSQKNTSQTIIVRLVSDENSLPVPFATVISHETQDTLQADQNGIFELNVGKLDHVSLSIYSEKYQTKNITITVSDFTDESGDIRLTPKLYQMNDVVVYSATRQKQKITESPAAVYVQTPDQIDKSSRTGQIAQAFQGFTGIDVLQSGASDFIVNTRGFNGGLNRRILVLQDGRDAAMPLLGAQEWNSFSIPLDEFARVEFVRGPAASLYGANAYNGVLNLTSYAPKDVLGAKADVLLGDYKTLKVDGRYAGMSNRLSYKLTIGHSERLNWANRRDSLQFLEYPGLPLEKKTLTPEDRNTTSNYGTVRLDYDLFNEKSITAEAGYSRNTNEMFVFGLGRTFVKDVERPYARLAFNSSNFHLQAHFMQRSVKDTMWLMVPGAPLLDNSKDYYIEGQYNLKLINALNFVFGASYDFQQIRTSNTSIPFDLDANYQGVYGQLEYKTPINLDFVASARVDAASIHSTQFSPRLALVFRPLSNHKFRISVGHSFQRPNYSDLYRLTPDAPAFDPITGKPINFNAITQKINDTLAVLTGSNPNLNLGLNATNAKAVGNSNLKVEKNLGFDFGYDGIYFDRIQISIDAYYNQLSDFITNFLPGVNPDIPQWTPDLPDNLKQYQNLVQEMVFASLSARDRTRLSNYNGVPTFVVSNTNIGEVNQWGVELNLSYYLSKNMHLDFGYSNYDFKVVKSSTAQELLPNTSPNKYNVGASYNENNIFDAELNFSYVKGYPWLAGTYIGYVPDYALLNLNFGVYLVKNLEIGANIYNLLDRKHYEIFGGTYVPRYTTVKISYKI